MMPIQSIFAGGTTTPPWPYEHREIIRMVEGKRIRTRKPNPVIVATGEYSAHKTVYWLAAHPGSTTHEVAASQCIALQSMTRHLRELAAEGYVSSKSAGAGRALKHTMLKLCPPKVSEQILDFVANNPGCTSAEVVAVIGSHVNYHAQLKYMRETNKLRSVEQCGKYKYWTLQ